MSDTPATTAASTAYPRLRTDLRVSCESGGAFVIEDAASGQFHRIGSAEYAVLSRLDGSLSLASAAAVAGRGAAATMESAKLKLFANWLRATNLLAGGAAPQPPKPAALANPAYIKIPLPVGERFLDRLTDSLGWLFTWPALVLAVLATLLAAGQVVLHWSAMAASTERILCADQHLLLAACWLVLKLVHEVGHGVASRRLGGDVREFGIAIIFFVPVPYTDVTTSWRCPRRERMIIAAAGMYFEWLIALLAVGLWSCSTSAAVQQASVYVMSLATLTTILFNANPLCRMDGYYILSDLLGLQNLAAQGQRVSRAWLSWLFLGQAPPDKAPSKHRFAFGCYGLLARVWRTLSLATMALLALLVYEGLGLVMLGSIALAWHLQARAARAAQTARQAANSGFSPAGAARLLLIASSIGLLLWLVPWPGGITAPGSVENVERQVVRAPCAAQVAEILVVSGEHVAAGQAIARLKNDELALELAELESALAQGEVKQRSQRTKKQLVEWQVEEHRQESLAERIAKCREQLDLLTVRAPIAGSVIARRLADLPGSYLAEGAEICSVASDEQEFRLLIAERDVAAFSDHLGKAIEVSLVGQTATGVLDRLDPAATTGVGESNLAASAGGPLAVVPDPNSTWRLKEPRVVGHVRLDGAEAVRLLAGQRGFVSITPPRYSVAQHLAGVIRGWLEKLSAQARQRTAANRAAAAG